MRSHKRAHAKSHHEGPAGRNLQADGHEQGRFGRFERVPGNIPNGRSGAERKGAADEFR